MKEMEENPRFKEIMNGIKHAFHWSVDSESLLIKFVGKNISLLGLSANTDFSSKKIIDLCYPLDRDTFLKTIGRARKNEASHLEHRFLNGFGKITRFQTEMFLSADQREICGLSIELSGPEKNINSMYDVEKLRLVFQYSTDLICVAETNGYFKEINPAFVGTLGYSEEELLQINFFNLVHPDDLERTKKVMETLSRGEVVKDFENRYRKKSGEYVWLSWMSIPILGTNQLYAISRDITDKKRSVELLEDVIEEKSRELSESREFLELVLESIPQMVFVKDASELRFVHFNRAGEELLGYSRKDLIGKNDYDFFPKDQADFFTSKDRAVLSGKNVVNITEEEILTKSGVRFLKTKKVPLFGKDGRPVFLLGFSEDITDWKKHEEERVEMIQEQGRIKERAASQERELFLANISSALASSLNYHESLMKLVKIIVPSLGDWSTIFILQNDGTLQRIASNHRDSDKNILFEELEKYSSFETHFPQLASVVKEGKSILSTEVDFDLLEKVTENRAHLEIFHSLGLGEFILTPIIYGEKIHGLISVVLSEKSRHFSQDDYSMIQEIGRRAGVAMENISLYETAQQAIAIREEFLSVASHELRTPVTALKLKIQMIRRSIDVEKAIIPPVKKLATFLDQTNLYVNRLTNLIEDLLDVSRIGQNKIIFKTEVIDFSELVEEMCVRYEEHLSSFGCELHTKIQRGVVVLGDRNRLEQVILNLLTNAAKFGEERPVYVELKSLSGNLLLSVADQGIGIPPGKITKIFDRFERTNISKNISGLGLGLYISREIVKAHHGKIWAESEVDVGSTFYVELPTHT